MNIIIIGCGKIGTELAEQLNNEGHNMTIVDIDESVLSRVATSLDVMGVTGNGATREVQLEAGVKTADLLIATTESDELNMLCCLLARRESDIFTIARVRNPEYESEIEYLKKELNLSQVINPEKIAARKIVHLLRFPSAEEVETFSKGKVDMVTMRLSEDSPVCGTALRDLSKKVRSDVLISVISRGNEVIIPSGDTVLTANDLISIVAKPNDVVNFCKECRLDYEADKSAIIVGGGKIMHYVADYMKSQHTRCALKVIEIREDRCRRLANDFPNLTVINGDGTNQQLLIEEGIEKCDAFVSLTGIDEENIVSSMMIGGISKARRITKVNYFDTDQLTNVLGIGSVVCPKEVTAENVVRFVRSLESSKDSDLESLYKVAGGKAEAVEFIVGNDPKLLDIPFAELKMKKNTLVAAIIRKGIVLKPGGSDMMKLGDHVVIITTDVKLSSLNDILM